MAEQVLLDLGHSVVTVVKDRSRKRRICPSRGETFVHVREGTGPVQINRENRSRQVTVFANLEKTENGKPKKLAAATGDILAIEKELGLPPGVKSKFTGEAEQSDDMTVVVVIAKT